MLVINGKTINGYKDYEALKSSDILEFMKDQSRADIEAFKAYAASVKTYTTKDGEEKERHPNWFEIRNWVLEKYAPGITAPAAKPTNKTLIDSIMEL